MFGGPPQKPDKLATPVLSMCMMCAIFIVFLLAQPPPMPPDVSVVDDLRYAKVRVWLDIFTSLSSSSLLSLLSLSLRTVLR